LKQKLKLLQEWAKIPTSSSILELGCANAVYTIPLKRLGYDIRGIDLAGDNIKESNRDRGKKNAAVCQQGIRASGVVGSGRINNPFFCLRIKERPLTK